MSERGYRSAIRAAVAGAAAVIVVGAGRPALAQKVVVFEGSTVSALTASHTRNGVPFFPPGIPVVTIDPFLVLFPDGTFGFFPRAATQPGGLPGFPVYGQVVALPDGALALSGLGSAYKSGTAQGEDSLSGVLFAHQGNFYAYLTYVGTAATPAANGDGAVTTVDVVTFLVALKVVSH